jgi:hypothetical protein
MWCGVDIYWETFATLKWKRWWLSIFETRTRAQIPGQFWKALNVFELIKNVSLLILAAAYATFPPSSVIILPRYWNLAPYLSALLSHSYGNLLAFLIWSKKELVFWNPASSRHSLWSIAVHIRSMIMFDKILLGIDSSLKRFPFFQCPGSFSLSQVILIIGCYRWVISPISALSSSFQASYRFFWFRRCVDLYVSALIQEKNIIQISLIIFYIMTSFVNTSWKSSIHHRICCFSSIISGFASSFTGLSLLNALMVSIGTLLFLLPLL